ncbi:hypothetical protein V6N11_067080 [Hibiscus sabdariffa]|uniref:BRCA1-associated 2/ETP1 RRM domain-containing protein n=1 Tax=Hibiscus sabdariffa TaxID=183260 RepID=A0ABR2SPN3_9ROSI
MFLLRVHSVDTETHLADAEDIEFYTTTSPSNPKFRERRGAVHLYRQASQSSLPIPTTRSTSLFVVAVPNYLSAAGFIRFAGFHLENVSYLLFIRNDGMGDRYSVLIELVNQSAADKFYFSLNGKRFSPAERDWTPDTGGILRTFCDHSFQRSCTSKWTYLSCTVCRFCQQQDERLFKGDGYVHQLNHSRVDGKLVEMNSRCTSVEGTCRSCGYGDDSGINEVIYSSKVEAVFDEYSQLLATELEKQRQTSRVIWISAQRKKCYCRGVQFIAFVTALVFSVKVNRKLIKDQQVWREKVKEMEEREASESRLLDERILDLQEQIRVLKVYIEAQNTLVGMTDSDSIGGGTVLPVPSSQSSCANGNRRHKKSGRRRN